MHSTIGIDISKDILDAHRLNGGETIQVRNDKVGHKALVKWIGKSTKPLIVFEATGAYHRQLEFTLGANGLPAAKVNPKQARRFAQATGRLAKTDRVDAAMLARMGAVLSLEPQAPPEKSLHDLKELLSARRALVKDQTAARARQATATLPLIKRQFDARLKQIDTDIGKVDAAMAEIVAKGTPMSERMAILQSIPGVGRVTAITMLIDMPELGKLDGKQVACLAGLAPISQQSGKWQGKERIQGGRATLHRALYMPALVAVRFNPDLKEKYDQLVRAGKQKKVALIAIMRKLLVMANALLRDGRQWTEIRP
jgi:transposase